MCQQLRPNEILTTADEHAEKVSAHVASWEKCFNRFNALVLYVLTTFNVQRFSNGSMRPNGMLTDADEQATIKYNSWLTPLHDLGTHKIERQEKATTRVVHVPSKENVSRMCLNELQ